MSLHRSIIVLLLCTAGFSSPSGFAQPGPDVIFNQEKGNDVQRLYYPNGQLQAVIRKKDGKLHGEQLSYFANGKKKLISNYKDNVLHGKYEEYYENGKPASLSKYQDGQYIGTWKTFHNNGNLKFERNYTMVKEGQRFVSVLDGKYQELDVNGNRIKEGVYREGKQDGIWKTYRNDVLVDWTTYKMGKRHGEYKRFFETGNPSESGKYYELLEIDSLKFVNIEDGPKRVYYPNGTLERTELYKLGKKEGEFIRYYADGKVMNRQSFANGELAGLMETFDDKGNPTQRVHYKLVEVDGVLKGVKNGEEKAWKNNVMTMQTQFVDGLENGKRISYFPDGKVSVINHFVSGKLNGQTIEYYPNGKIKSERTYATILQGSSDKILSLGWSNSYNESGELQSAYFRDSTDNTLIAKKYYNGKLANFEASKAIGISYFPTGEVMSIRVYDQYDRPAFASYYYMSGKLRKLSFQHPSKASLNHVDLTDDGQIISIYTDGHQNPDSLKVSQQEAMKYIASAGQFFIPNKLFTDQVKEGKYSLVYGNGSPFLRVNFKNDLTIGEFVCFEPVNGDTLVYRNFDNAAMRGDYLEKYGGKTVYQRGYKRSNPNETSYETYNWQGIPSRKQLKLTDGSIDYMEFYPSGALKSKNNEKQKRYYSYFENGDLISSNEPMNGNPSRRVNRDYFSETHSLRSEGFSTNNLRDSLYYFYYENGQLRSKTPYLGGKRNGAFAEYTVDGKLTKKGFYADDKAEGEWVQNIEATPDTFYFRNGNRVVKPPKIQCACIDTSYSSSRIGFAPSVSGLAEYEVIKNYIPGYLVPVNDLNYGSIFYTGLQISSGRDNGFVSMNMMVYKELAFNIPSNEQLQLVLNPCITPGYIPRMPISVSYFPNHPEGTYAEVEVNDLEVRFLKGPIKSKSSDHEHFTSRFKVKQFTLQRDEVLTIETHEQDQSCFVPGVIRDFLEFEIVEGVLELFGDQQSGWDRQNELIDMKSRAAFFGINATNVNYRFKAETDHGEISLFGYSPYSLLGGEYAAGQIQIRCQSGDENAVVVFDDAGVEQNIQIERLRNQWLKLGFTRLSMVYNNELQSLVIRFFAE